MLWNYPENSLKPTTFSCRYFNQKLRWNKTFLYHILIFHYKKRLYIIYWIFTRILKNIWQFQIFPTHCPNIKEALRTRQQTALWIYSGIATIKLNTGKLGRDSIIVILALLHLNYFKDFQLHYFPIALLNYIICI